MKATRQSVDLGDLDESARGSSRRGRASASGRLSLPAGLRREAGLEKRGSVRIEVVDGGIQIRTMNEVKEPIRTLAIRGGLAERGRRRFSVLASAAEGGGGARRAVR